MKLEDLNNKNIYLWEKGLYQVSDNIRSNLLNLNLNVNIYKRDSINIIKLISNFDSNKDIVIIEDAWSKFSNEFSFIPLENYPITFGLYYLKKNANKFKEFISELKEESEI